ncbi:MAG: MexH family multidrug efflux RND transporter periplasmic adaptor subunit [Bacteroidia bacterium]|nr:MAG: MexH family multidrug efflux RND transporter periplasmic adaptor subunit [Bacteroidia bacterium]
MQILSLVLSAAAVLLLQACGQSDARTGATGEPAERRMEPVAVRVEEVFFSRFTDAIRATGIVKGRDDVMLSPEEGGVIKQWLVEKGRPVRAGEVIVLLKDEVLEAGYQAALAQYKLAELNVTKQREVYRQQGISELQFRSLEYTRDAAKAQADLAKARLDRTRLRSPINGVLNDRFADEGEFAPPGVPVAHILDASSVKVAAEISEKLAGHLAVGLPASVIPDAFPSDTLEGRISYVGAAVSASNRTIPVEILIPNPSNRLKPEMIARVSILRSDSARAILIDERVLQLVDRGKVIVFVEKDGVAEQRQVRVGNRRGSRIEILEGLKPGDKVIVSGFQRLVDGQPVMISG